jgi:ankyrin repeat protein
MMSAIESGDASAVRKLIESGSVNVSERQALVLAVQCERLAIVDELLKAGVCVNDANGRQSTACKEAIVRGRIDILERLLEHQPVVSLLGAWQCRRINMLPMLINAGALLDDDTVVRAASTSVAAIEALLVRGVDLSRTFDADRCTPLHLAAASDMFNPAVNKLLVDVGVNLNHRNSTGDTCCHIAAANAYDNDQHIRWLINAGAEIDCVDDVGRTPLLVACVRSKTRCALALLAGGASVESRASTDGKTPAHLALERTNGVRLFHVLLAAGADQNVVGLDGFSAREILAMRGLSVDSDMVEAGRRLIAKSQLEFVRDRALQVCIGLAPLRLDALQTCEVLQFACGRFAQMIPFHKWWAIATLVKHFH